MHNPQTESLVIQVIIDREEGLDTNLYPNPHPRSRIPSPNLLAMKLFHRFRKILMRLVFFSVPSNGSSGKASKHKNSDRFEPPKTSCSSYYSSYSHYNEAIADCIEFFNKSAQEGFLDARKSDVISH